MRLLEIEDLANSPQWWNLWARDGFQHPWYLPDQLLVAATRRPSCYYLPHSLQPLRDPAATRECRPLSLLAHDSAGPVLGLTLSIERVDGVVRLSAFGRPLCPIEDRSASGPRRKSAAKLVHRRLEELRKEYGAQRYHLRDLLYEGRLSSLSELVLRAGGQALPFFSQLIDLRRSIDEIRADLRSSLRNLVHRRRPDCDIELVTHDNVNSGHRDLLRSLHLRQHGQELHTEGGWEALRRGVAARSAFFLFGSVGGEHACGAYFAYSDTYCHYSIGANDPSKYGAGLSHLLLWRAIEYSRELGCRLFEIGDRIYPGQHDWVPEKFHAISHFKAGFGSLVAGRLDVMSAA